MSQIEDVDDVIKILFRVYTEGKEFIICENEEESDERETG